MSACQYATLPRPPSALARAFVGPGRRGPVEQRPERLSALDQVPALLPEPPERRGRVEGHLDPAIVGRSLDRRPQVVLLGIEAVEPLRRAGAE